ncbi:carboxypeptidase-like regulatory domain-containing protein, partial [Metabacillus fastidiosus]|uniref:carboxypeptidase-like regulatory domain-containing protein n=1 Tax=Metabacillus fastidiosus TaxID=1458 RepID=UPI002E23F015|nr:carboxypeptidase-like regulatory domain-containing protein [Metabacillus fastidiosus]
SNSGIIVASTQTDQNGQYVLTGLAPGTYNVVFSADNFSGQTSTVTLTAGETETVNASLTPNPATITGTVTDAFTGNPIANALIQVFNSQGILINSTLSDNNGQFSVTGLPEGALTVQASANNFASQVQTVTLTPGETETVNFSLPPNPASISGTVTDSLNGNPIAGALVQAFLVGTTIPVRSTLTDSNGNYVLTGLNEGEYRLEISDDNYASFISRIVLAPGESRTLDASLAPNPATIQGRLVDAQTGEPIAGAAVITVLSNSGIIVASTQTDQNGQYVLTGLAPGTYNVVFSADNFAGQTSTVTLTAGETETINASLTPNPATITGTVTDAFTGNPI